MTTIEYVKNRWEVLLLLVGLASVGWYANAQVTAIEETQEIAKANAETLAIIVEERKIEKALEVSEARIRVLEARLAAEGVILETVRHDMEVVVPAGSEVEEEPPN